VLQQTLMTMMSLPASSSEPATDPSQAFESLHPKVQEWVWHQQWQHLRAVQGLAVAPILDGNSDVIVSAATASGKTEAAWLPICSTLAFDAGAETSKPGVKALYISPLKALINDQYDRLQSLCEYADLPIYRRHGDVSGADRNEVAKNPDGLLLITPESLEALFVNQGNRVPVMLNGLRYVVIDELHSFIGTERGAQLQSLLHRVELATRRRVPRVALSATIADQVIASEFLRPGQGSAVTFVRAPDESTEIQLILRGYIRAKPQGQVQTHELVELDDEEEVVDDSVETKSIAENIFKNMRGKDNLVFANARHSVETYADILTRMSEDLRVPNEFFAHHGSLSKEHREDVERMLKSNEFNATAICTSTLELGIDIGSADAIGQIGAPGSVSALRQRLGRSGRRGGPAVLRMYVVEPELTPNSGPVDQLRTQLVQTIAVVELLLEKWYEPPNTASLHLSTLIQQVLSLIAQHGGVTAPQLFSALCSNGPFARVNRDMFLRLLRDLGATDLISQVSDGTLLPGELGEKIINHYSFYAVFQTPDEYRLVAYGQTLGSIPIYNPLVVGGLFIFAGRRWQVLNIDSDAKVVELVRAKGGRPPNFDSGGLEVADGIRRKMRSIYEDISVPAYLNATSQQLLSEGRAAFRRLQLDRSPIYSHGNNTVVFPWRGDLIMNTLAVVLINEGIETSLEGVALECRNTSSERLLAVLSKLSSFPAPDPIVLARRVVNKVQDKYDQYLGEPLLAEAYAARNLDVAATWSARQDILSAWSSDGD
jgi:ATP-dependent helicase Lhr and Lhr-like helicase